MKTAAATATLAGLSSAVSTEALSALMQFATFGSPTGERFGGVQNPFGQNSNVNDSDLKRQNPDFANPANKGQVREIDDDPHIENMPPLRVRHAIAALKDPQIARQPDVRPLYEGVTDMWEPIDYTNRKKLSPIFLVDPKFTMGKTGDENQLFIDHYHAGWDQGSIHTGKWPIIQTEVQSFFGVGRDCTCKDTHKAVFARIPSVIQLEFGHYPHSLGPVYEPQYEQANYVIPKNMYDTMYRGDDFGGHNIPYPHPCPPMPHEFYELDAFVDLGKYFNNMYNGVVGGDLGGYTMTPHGQAGWSSEKAYKGATLMRYMPKSEYGNNGYAAIQGYGSDPYAAPQGYGSDPYAAPQGYGSDPYAAPQGYANADYAAPESYGSDPYAAPQGYGSDPYAAPESYGSDPYAAPQGYGSDPYAAPQGYGSDPYAAPQGYGSDPYAAPQGYGSDPWASVAKENSGDDSYSGDATDVNVAGVETGFKDFKQDAEAGADY